MSYSGSQITRLGLTAIPRMLMGSFAGKAYGVVTPTEIRNYTAEIMTAKSYTAPIMTAKSYEAEIMTSKSYTAKI